MAVTDVAPRRHPLKGDARSYGKEVPVALYSGGAAGPPCKVSLDSLDTRYTIPSLVADAVQWSTLMALAETKCRPRPGRRHAGPSYKEYINE